MTQDEVIEMAKQVGVDMSLGEHWSFFIEELEAFAKLVDAKATAREREEIDQMVNDDRMLSDNDAIRLSKAIRARGEA